VHFITVDILNVINTLM